MNTATEITEIITPAFNPPTAISVTEKRPVFLHLFKRWMWIAIIVSAVLQCIFFWSPENLFAVISVFIGWKLTEMAVLRYDIIKKYTLSVILIIGFSLSQFSLPLIFTLTEGKPLIFNMNFPYQVFFHSILAILIMITTHLLYTGFLGKSGRLKKSIQRILNRFKFYTPPTELQIWIIGFFGVFSILFKFFAYGNRYEGASAEADGTGARFVEGFIMYMYAPLLLLLRPLYSKTNITIKSLYTKVLFYTLVLIGVGIACNSRGTFMRGITAVGIAYFAGLLLNKFDYKMLFKSKYIISGAFIIWIITGPLADLGTSMVMMRGMRNNVSGAQLFSKTLDGFNDKKAIEKFKISSIKHEYQGGDWNEHYFDNLFLARFCNLKYNDASLGLANKLGRVDPILQQYAIDRLLACFPQPILNFLQIKIDKQTISTSSTADVLFMRTGGTSVLGSQRLGQFAGTGMASFGWWYLLYFGMILIPIYFLVDLFNTRTNSKSNDAEIYISLPGLIVIADIFMFCSLSNVSTSESVGAMYTYVIRGWIQTTILFIFIYFIARKISYVVKAII